MTSCSSPSPVADVVASTVRVATTPPPATSAPASARPAPKTTRLTVVEAPVTKTARPKPVAPRKPAPVRRDLLTGGSVSAGPLLVAKIDNTSAGFPQFGVARADIVYVEQVEGGLTRLIALFHSVLPDEVGPIRSVRSTDSELLCMYGTPGLAFSGGAGGPLDLLTRSTVRNLSPDRSDRDYWRSQFGDGTHNLHVDLASLAAGTKGLGEPKSPGFSFAATDPRLARASAVTSIRVTMQSGRTGFRYAKGRYLVDHRDTPYVDHDGTSVTTDNVLVQNVTDEADGTVDSVGSPSYLSHTVGTGTFTLYRDGRSITGTWKRPSAAAPTSYLDGSGKPVLFKPGKTWVLLAPGHSQVATG